LCTGAAARLEEAGIRTAGDVLARPEELHRILGLSMAEIKTVLHETRTGHTGDKGSTLGAKKGKRFPAQGFPADVALAHRNARCCGKRVSERVTGRDLLGQQLPDAVRRGCADALFAGAARGVRH
jgi:hypothetical protein